MAECRTALICDHALFDELKKPSVIGIFSEIWTERVPTMHRRLVIFTEWVGEPSEHVAFEVDVERPTGERLRPEKRFRTKVQLSDHGRGYHVHNIQGLPLPDLGPYTIHIVDGETEYATIDFSVQPGEPSAL